VAVWLLKRGDGETLRSGGGAEAALAVAESGGAALRRAAPSVPTPRAPPLLVRVDRLLASLSLSLSGEGEEGAKLGRNRLGWRRAISNVRLDPQRWEGFGPSVWSLGPAFCPRIFLDLKKSEIFKFEQSVCVIGASE
jgi:hypothetical protein